MEIKIIKTIKGEKLIFPPYEPKRGWYIIYTPYNKETKVFNYLKTILQNTNLNHNIFKILLPKNKTWIYRQYIYVEMIPDTNTLYQINKIPDVISVLGSNINEPTIVSKNEMDTLFEKIGLSNVIDTLINKERKDNLSWNLI